MCEPDSHLHSRIHTARKLSSFIVTELFRLFFDVFICVFFTSSCNDACIDKCCYSLVICVYLYVYRRFPEVVKSNCNFHICGSVLPTVRDICITRMGMVEITYICTQVLVEKCLEKPCVGGRILIIKCQLMSCQCVERPYGSESCSLAVWSEHCNKSLGLRGGEFLNHICHHYVLKLTCSVSFGRYFILLEIKANFSVDSQNKHLSKNNHIVRFSWVL